MKYVIFINSLLTTLIESKLCCTVYHIKTSPVGYADDVAAASTAKSKIDEILRIVNSHSKKWRYELNAGKSAVLVFGESINENIKNAGYRNFRLGDKKVKEKVTYDHVGVKSCIGGSYQVRTREKVKKGRKVLNAAAGLGFKKGGLTMMASNLIFWTVVVPTTIYGSELWILKEQDIEMLDDFQRDSGRRIQRLPPKSPNETCFVGLGWMRLENFIYARKLIFVRTILVRDENCIVKQTFKSRAIKFNTDICIGNENKYDSPVYDILRIAIMYGVYGEIMRMVVNSHMYDKNDWKKKIWERAWKIEDEDCHMRLVLHKSLRYVDDTIGTPKYFVWWAISDTYPWLMKECELMVKIMCKASKLKCDDYALTTFAQKSCSLCNLAAYETIEHVAMSCSYFDGCRHQMLDKIRDIPNGAGTLILESGENITCYLLGKPHPQLTYDDMIPFWIISCRWIYKMYSTLINIRTGVG